MEQSPFSEVNSHSHSQEFSFDGNLSFSTVFTTACHGPYSEPDESIPHSPKLFLKDLLRYFLPIYI